MRRRWIIIVLIFVVSCRYFNISNAETLEISASGDSGGLSCSFCVGSNDPVFGNGTFTATFIYDSSASPDKNGHIPLSYANLHFVGGGMSLYAPNSYLVGSLEVNGPPAYACGHSALGRVRRAGFPVVGAFTISRPAYFNGHLIA